MISSKKIANYYLQSLRQSSLVEATSKYTKPLEVPFKEVVAGQLSSQELATFVKRAQKNQTKDETASRLNVFIMPIVIKTEKDFTYPFIIPATLTEEGQLTHEEYTIPWIQRQLMTPVTEDSTQPPRYQPIADVGDYFDAIEGGIFDHLDWCEYMTQSDTLFNQLTNQSIDSFTSIKTANGQPLFLAKAGFCHIIPGEQNLGFSAQIQALYQDILATNQSLPLFESLNPETNIQNERVLAPASLEAHYANHLGQMTSKHGMTETQRNALANLDATTNGQTLAVSGPPGTGKTTLLQSVVATQWVRAALEETMPPICVASSVNNQAVTNIIQSFQAGELSAEEISAFSLPQKKMYQKISAQKRTLISHWLPEHNTYGLYLVSKQKLTASQASYAAISSQDTTYLDNLANPDTLKEATKAFLKNYHMIFSDTTDSLQQCQKTLHDYLKNVVKDIRTIISGLSTDFNKQITNLGVNLSKQTDQLAESKANVDQAESQLRGWYDFDAKHASVLDYFPFIGPKRKATRKIDYLHLKGFSDDIDLQENLDHLRNENNSLTKDLKTTKMALADVQHRQKAYQKACDQNQIKLTSASGEVTQDINNQIDTKLRYLAFLPTTHYWEARWLIEMTQKQLETASTAYEKTRKIWQLRAMLTPCFVGTFFQVDAFFRKDHTPLFNGIDLLIADESGQVSPELAIASLALAKRFLTVGDVKQIPPIWGMQASVDEANMRSLAKLSPEEISALKGAGFATSSGNLMTVAQHQSFFTQADMADGGLLLREHFRCLPKITAYFNHLAYQGKLIPKRHNPTVTSENQLPQLGYAHVFGVASTENGSRYNQREADTIAQWLCTRKERLHNLETAKDTNWKLGNTVAVLTPFNRQAEEIKAALKRHGLDDQKIVVGTVHAMQGAERRVILFSPVYDSTKTPFFFDQGVNMLNVAVSRAKDSFLYFGNIDLLSTQGDSPSDQLARQLFSDRDNEIKDVTPFTKEEIASSRAIVLEDAKSHDQWLYHQLLTAKKQIDISSPYISKRSIETGTIALLNAIKQATGRGVRVNVYPNRAMYDQRDRHRMANFDGGIDLLKASGATILEASSRVHSKQVVIDGHILANGSFNWFSAVRDETSPYYNRDTSTVIDDENLVKKFSLPLFNLAKEEESAS
ncbi:AAA domain-containing protein [Lacticaseibacillus paracasei]|uniref:AAA domain-containing protein n=1 Tax=Lacticaseibacillus paracasei TaxID=1597 RepID=UPI0018A62AE2|nr:AAA domain-containing protein [Lacticaseibacillus paracasei]QOP47205.1 AAA family ATPase [Lacticaseibacillus paracasei]